MKNWVAATTSIVVLASIFILVLYDVWAYMRGGTEGTISWWIYSQSFEHPMIPFGVGVLCGHFFWNLKKKVGDKNGKL